MRKLALLLLLPFLVLTYACDEPVPTESQEVISSDPLFGKTPDLRTRYATEFSVITTADLTFTGACMMQGQMVGLPSERAVSNKCSVLQSSEPGYTLRIEHDVGDSNRRDVTLQAGWDCVQDPIFGDQCPYRRYCNRVCAGYIQETCDFGIGGGQGCSSSSAHHEFAAEMKKNTITATLTLLPAFFTDNPAAIGEAFVVRGHAYFDDGAAGLFTLADCDRLDGYCWIF